MLPLSGDADTVTIMGKCVAPCDCGDMAESPVCGQDGRTYGNLCLLQCASGPTVQVSSCKYRSSLVVVN